jgi:PncC family amidohydrolase
MKREIAEAVRKVHEIFKKKGMTLTVAESCTGGLISHYMTSLPGASTFFKAGIVSYSGDVKERLIGVSPETLRRYGVVSEETARGMAEKVRLLMKTDFSVSTTGNLGPDVLEGKEKGLIYIAVNREGETASHTLKLQGNREENKEEASLSALRFLIEFVEKR